MKKPLIILVTRSAGFTSVLTGSLASQHKYHRCDSLEEAGEFASTQETDGLIVDFSEATTSGHEQSRLLTEFQTRHPDRPIAIITGSDCPEVLERHATCDGMLHLRGSMDADRIAAWLKTEFPVDAAPQPPVFERTSHGRNGKATSTPVMSGITRRFETNTPQLRRMLDDLEIAAQHDVTILLIGETGSGKTFLSSLIHEVSPRCDAPFLPVACGALPKELIESELFGHVKGAFTSAHANKEGKFIAAGCGTILLDEIDVLGPEQQVKLLRVIETGEFEPVGSNQTLKSQARLVVASNLELQPLVEQGRFRPDLYYRLNMLKFEIPPLRRRKPDITILARTFVEQLSQKHRVAVDRVDESLYDALLNYPWPGNVRELENVIQRAVIFCRDGILTADHLPKHVVMGMVGPSSDPSVRLHHTMTRTQGNLNHQVSLTERDIIEQTLFKNNFSRTNTAKELGISRVTLYNKMKKYGMSH